MVIVNLELKSKIVIKENGKNVDGKGPFDIGVNYKVTGLKYRDSDNVINTVTGIVKHIQMKRNPNTNVPGNVDFTPEALSGMLVSNTVGLNVDAPFYGYYITVTPETKIEYDDGDVIPTASSIVIPVSSIVDITSTADASKGMSAVYSTGKSSIEVNMSKSK